MSPRMFVIACAMSFGIFFSTICSSAVAAPNAAGASVGTVDLSLLIIFHPQMSWYDPGQKAFRKQAPARMATDVARKGQELTDQARRIGEQKRLLEGRMEELRRTFDRQTRALQDDFDKRISDLATGSAAVERNMFQVRNNQLHLKFNAEIKALSGQIQLLDQQFNSTAGTDVTGQMTGPAETEQMFRGILQEIRNTVSQVAAAKGVGVVLDRGPSDLIGTLNVSDSELPGENVYARLLSTAAGPHTGQDTAAAQGHFTYQASLGQTWLRSRMAILAPFQQALFSQRVVVGGVDLTFDCLNTLLQQKRVTGPALQAILACVRGER